MVETWDVPTNSESLLEKAKAIRNNFNSGAGGAVALADLCVEIMENQVRLEKQLPTEKNAAQRQWEQQFASVKAGQG